MHSHFKSSQPAKTFGEREPEIIAARPQEDIEHLDLGSSAERADEAYATFQRERLGRTTGREFL